ncbi:unnamed protein product [Fraxinus pennsylvanica]|uniref:RING-type domain-containing protein n=1 Tax=Fraxinus pennsylvanica TaxID=56036 RepID=A0AAD2A426_9LAMI|nr:unnamed protein product [Fraxinus pennsylvanica]
MLTSYEEPFTGNWKYWLLSSALRSYGPIKRSINCLSKMNWNSQMEVHYPNHAMPYNSIGSFVDYFGGLTYDHGNFIFADAPYVQESAYAAANTNLYKYAVSEPGSFSYYEYWPGCGSKWLSINKACPICYKEKSVRKPLLTTGFSCVNTSNENFPWYPPNPDSPTPPNGRVSATYCTRKKKHFTGETRRYNLRVHVKKHELLELGEAVGNQNRGLSQELIALLPLSKFKCGLFSRKRFRAERCVICQMEYKRHDRQMTLPCKHVYHAGCGSKWLSINKACPICYKEVIVNAPKD